MAMNVFTKKTVGCVFLICFWISLIGFANIITVNGFKIIEQPEDDPGLIPDIQKGLLHCDTPYYQDYLIRRSVNGYVPYSEKAFYSFLNRSYENRKTLTKLLPERYYYPNGPVIGQGFNAYGEITVHILEGCEISNETMDEIEFAIRSESKILEISDTPIVFYYDIIPVLDIKNWSDGKTT